jgi:hypothetical protein
MIACRRIPGSTSRPRETAAGLDAKLPFVSHPIKLRLTAILEIGSGETR